jgi:hypothetical protein
VRSFYSDSALPWAEYFEIWAPWPSTVTAIAQPDLGHPVNDRFRPRAPDVNLTGHIVFLTLDHRSFASKDIHCFLDQHFRALPAGCELVCP